MRTVRATDLPQPMTESSRTHELIHFTVQIFRAIHNAYIGQLSNPFAPLDAEKTTGFDAPITNRRFADVMATIAGRGPETAST